MLEILISWKLISGGRLKKRKERKVADLLEKSILIETFQLLATMKFSRPTPVLKRDLETETMKMEKIVRVKRLGWVFLVAGAQPDGGGGGGGHRWPNTDPTVLISILDSADFYAHEGERTCCKILHPFCLVSFKSDGQFGSVSVASETESWACGCCSIHTFIKKKKGGGEDNTKSSLYTPVIQLCSGNWAAPQPCIDSHY